jgi:hypothetical protein
MSFLWILHALLVMQVGAQIKKQTVRGDLVLWLSNQALSAKEFVTNDGHHQKCHFHTLRAVLTAVDQFVTVLLSKHVLAVLTAMLLLFSCRMCPLAEHILLQQLLAELHLQWLVLRMLRLFSGGGACSSAQVPTTPAAVTPRGYLP